ncbi:glycosyltransferase [Polaribacter sp. MED152]|uniref:glycosyltransferase n=1 Tax=Polaribacter sp. MED152 TaxID=313598 RepID=UPI000186F3FB|nr:glycosyltransferase [Polaribacter sp. MED152]
MKYICMIVDGAYPNDIRVRKEAESLAENGKNVLVVCPRKKDDVQSEIINDVTIFRIGTNYTNSKKGIYDIIESVTNINPLFYKGLKLAFQKYQIAYLHVHDLPLAGTGFMFKNHVKRIYLDLHENYPEALKTWFLWKQSKLIQFKNRLFMNPKLWSKKEEKYCKKYDKVICVVEEMKTKLIANFGIDERKLVVVSNHEKKEFADNFKHAVAQNIITDKEFSITYVGGFGPHRGLQTAIEAMPNILKNIPEAKLFLIGKGSVDVEHTLKQLVVEHNLQNSVVFVGYRPFDEVSTIMQKTNINIIPHLANEHTDNTIPHKLFQIMMSKSLLLVSSCKPLQRIVNKYDAGIVFKANDTNDFAKKVVDIYQNYSTYQLKTENAFNAVMQKNENWEAESIKLLSLYID